MNKITHIIFDLFNTLYRFDPERENTQIDAAKIIGKHFPEIDDKILNILQLNELSDSDNLLIQASITQKTENIKSFSFRKFN